MIRSQISNLISEIIIPGSSIDMDVSKNRGTPKRMVNIREHPIRIDDLGIPLFLETPICKISAQNW